MKKIKIWLHSILYDFLYWYLDVIIKKENPCKITCTGCIRSHNFCCSGCSYLGNKGCTVKALTCKAWFCDSTILSEDFQKKIEWINKILTKFNLYSPRSSKEDTIEWYKRRLYKQFKHSYL